MKTNKLTIVSFLVGIGLAIGIVTRLPGASATAPTPQERAAELEKQIQALRQEVNELRKTPELTSDNAGAGGAGSGGAGGAPTAGLTPVPGTPTTRPAQTAVARRVGGGDPVIERIREEGLNRSQVMQTLSYLTDVIGPRLTGSPNLKRANEWTRDRMASWGLADAHLEAWGPFGRGWSLKRFSIQVVEPQAIPLIGFPKAWSPGLDEPVVADVVYLDARNEEELKKFEGKLKGAVVLSGAVRDVQARFEPLALRVADSDLLQLANSTPGSASPSGQARASTAAERAAAFGATPVGRGLVGGAATQPAGGGRRGGFGGGGGLAPGRVLAFALKEGAAAVVGPSTQGDGGTFFISQASLPGEGRGGFAGGGGGGGGNTGPRVWSADAPPMPAQITLSAEHYNRLVRMIQAGEKLKIALDLQVQYHNDDLMAYNTIAEIPGTDLKDQIVMLGAHMDSWHSGTGATDNGAGVAATMEAVRILKALDLHPRRTVRIGLWTGEEEGLMGSHAYVAEHFGTLPTGGRGGGARAGGAGGRGRGGAGAGGAGAAVVGDARDVIRKSEYDRLSVYFNLDNGTGKIRGVYLQGNENVRPIFRKWLAPFADLGAETLTANTTGGTDHLSFDAIGLPGFQFIQDPLEYWSRTHHSNADTFDRIQAEDMKQSSTILAAFVYNAAMMDEKMAKKGTVAPGQ